MRAIRSPSSYRIFIRFINSRIDDLVAQLRLGVFSVVPLLCSASLG